MSSVTIGVMRLDLRFPEPQSLKGKRMLLKSLTDRTRKQFNVAVSELDGMDLWQTSLIAVASVARDSARVHQILSHVLEFIRKERNVEVIKESLELF